MNRFVFAPVIAIAFAISLGAASVAHAATGPYDETADAKANIQAALAQAAQSKLPVRVDVTPRRVQRFLCLPGEPLQWRFGAQSGVLRAGEDGSVTVPGLELSTEWQTLRLWR